jgi:hypothetical protein
MTAASYRFLQEEMTGEVARRLAQGVLRASGLSWFTQAGRWAFGMDLLGHVTDQVSHSFDALNPRFQGAHPPRDHAGGLGRDPQLADRGAQGGGLDPASQRRGSKRRRRRRQIAADDPQRGRFRGADARPSHAGVHEPPRQARHDPRRADQVGVPVQRVRDRRRADPRLEIVQQAPATAIGYATAAFILTTLGGAARSK